MSVPGREERVRVRDRGASVWRVSGSGRPIVLVHSAGGNQRSFDPLLPHLAEHDVLVPSFPGRGASDGPPCESVEDSAAWLASLLEALDARDAVVAGHSVGGAIAIELALSAHAQRLARLVLISTGARLRVLPAIFDALDAAVVGNREPDLSRWLRADPARAHTPAATALADWLAANRFDRMNDVGRIAVPTTILSGTADTLTPPKYAAFLRERIPGAALESFEGAGHDLPSERPAEVAAVLAKNSAK